MTSEFIYLFSGFGLGLACSAGVHIRLCRRIIKHQLFEMEAKEVQKRRETIEFGDLDEPRPGAGEQASEVGLFSVRPGALMLTHLAEKNSEKT